MLRNMGTRIVSQYWRFLAKHYPMKFIKVRYKALFGKKINLENPTTFAEKIQWLKINDQNPLIVTCADKYLVREYVSQKIGDTYLVPLIAEWKSERDIDFLNLPNQFVLKPNNSSGRVYICKNKNTINEQQVKKLIERWSKENLTQLTGEWFYEKIDFRIVCEKYLSDNIMDYKLYFGNGKFICTQVIAGRSEKKLQYGYFDEEWKQLPIRRYNVAPLSIEIKKPRYYHEMIEKAAILAQGFSFIRIDMYYVEDHIYFGEMSFYPNNGFIRYENQEMDDFFASRVNLLE